MDKSISTTLYAAEEGNGHVVDRVALLTKPSSGSYNAVTRMMGRPWASTM
jgi:hypothetical protein